MGRIVSSMFVALLVVVTGCASEDRVSETEGTRGERGATGPQGVQGEQGPRGAQGPQGIQGERGLEGAPGMDGAIGATGERGPQGPQGIQGVAGPQGPAGAQGPAGPAAGGQWAVQVPRAAIAMKKEWLEVPNVAVSYRMTAYSNARIVLTAKVRASREGGGVAVCSLSLGGNGPFVHEDVEIQTPADGSRSVATYVVLRREFYGWSNMSDPELQLRVGRGDDSVPGTCVVSDAVLEVTTL